MYLVRIFHLWWRDADAGLQVTRLNSSSTRDRTSPHSPFWSKRPSIVRASVVAGATVVAVSAIGVSCQDPTEIIFEIDTDATCSQVEGTGITFGTRGGVDGDQFSVKTKACSAKGGSRSRIGSIVAVPSGEDDSEAAVRVVLGLGKSPEACVADGYTSTTPSTGCVVARRVVRFIPHTILTVPIRLDIDCLGIGCGVGQTCVGGSCVSAACSASGCAPPDAGASDTGGPDGPGDAPQEPDVVVPACTTQVATGGSHSCALMNDRSLWCWGSNGTGELGDGTASPRSEPVQLSGLDAVELALGSGFSCVRKAEGSVWCWGKNDRGQLGTGSSGPPSLVPVQVKLGAPASQISAGDQHACAVLTSGALWCWGFNSYGQVGNGSTSISQSTPVQVSALGTSVAKVGAGQSNTCARGKGATGGKLWCWGWGSGYKVGDGTQGQTCGGVSCHPNPVEVAAMGTNVTEIAVGGNQTCAAKADGTLWCWGIGTYGEIGVGSNSWQQTPKQVTALTKSVVGVTAGSNHTCARASDGTTWCWGRDSLGELGDGSGTLSTCSGVACSTLPVEVTALAGSLELASQARHSCARAANGSVRCWGSNQLGQVGSTTGSCGTSSCAEVPVEAPIAVACP